MLCSGIVMLLLTMALAVSADPFNWKSVACTLLNGCEWAHPNDEGCKKPDSYSSCVEKCPTSKPLAFLVDASRRYHEIGCRIRNETAMQESLAQFENVCAPHGAIGTCNDLLKCVHAIRDESKKEPRKEEAKLGYFEVDEIMILATYTWTWTFLENAEIPAKCAALYDKPLR